MKHFTILFLVLTMNFVYSNTALAEVIDVKEENRVCEQAAVQIVNYLFNPSGKFPVGLFDRDSFPISSQMRLNIASMSRKVAGAPIVVTIPWSPEVERRASGDVTVIVDVHLRSEQGDPLPSTMARVVARFDGTLVTDLLISEILMKYAKTNGDGMLSAVYLHH